MVSSENSLLLVEEDGKLAAQFRRFLTDRGLQVAVESRGDRAIQQIRKSKPACVILDTMLPGIDGFEVCRRIRPYYPGRILMLTPQEDGSTRPVDQKMGADDYLAKPVRPRVLFARIRALLGRGARNRQSKKPAAPLRIGRLLVDPGKRSAVHGGRRLRLTPREFDLLAYLATNAGRAVTREELSEQLRGAPYDRLDWSMDLDVARLRRKLGDRATRPFLIRSMSDGFLLSTAARTG